MHLFACKKPALAFIDRKNPEKGRCGNIPDDSVAPTQKNQPEEWSSLIQKLKRNYPQLIQESSKVKNVPTQNNDRKYVICSGPII